MIKKECNWSCPPELAELGRFYVEEAAHPEKFPDEVFLKKVRSSFWGTNCWAFVETAFAIIAPACARRPHLARKLIRSPIDAMIAGGLEKAEEVIPQGIACATKQDHYVEPTEEGKLWLTTEWLKLGGLVQEVFAVAWREMEEEMRALDAQEDFSAADSTARPSPPSNSNV